MHVYIYSRAPFRDFRQRKTVFDAIVVGRWSLFGFHFLCMPSSVRMILSLAGVVLTSVRYREIFRRNTISRYQSSKFGIYGYDILIYRILLYHMIWDMISRYIAIYHAVSHRITPKQQARNSQPRCGLLFVLVLCICPLLGFSFFRPAISGTHHRTDRTISK